MADSVDYRLAIYTSEASKAHLREEPVEWLQINVFVGPLSMEVFAQSQDPCDGLGKQIADLLHEQAPKLLSAAEASNG